MDARGRSFPRFRPPPWSTVEWFRKEPLVVAAPAERLRQGAGAAAAAQIIKKPFAIPPARENDFVPNPSTFRTLLAHAAYAEYIAGRDVFDRRMNSLLLRVQYRQTLHANRALRQLARSPPNNTYGIPASLLAEVRKYHPPHETAGLVKSMFTLFSKFAPPETPAAEVEFSHALYADIVDDELQWQNIAPDTRMRQHLAALIEQGEVQQHRGRWVCRNSNLPEDLRATNPPLANLLRDPFRPPGGGSQTEALLAVLDPSSPLTEQVLDALVASQSISPEARAGVRNRPRQKPVTVSPLPEVRATTSHSPRLQPQEILQSVFSESPGTTAADDAEQSPGTAAAAESPLPTDVAADVAPADEAAAESAERSDATNDVKPPPPPPMLLQRRDTSSSSSSSSSSSELIERLPSHRGPPKSDIVHLLVSSPRSRGGSTSRTHESSGEPEEKRLNARRRRFIAPQDEQLEDENGGDNRLLYRLLSDSEY